MFERPKPKPKRPKKRRKSAPTLTQAKKRAPRHPPAPEMAIRALLIATIAPWHKRLARAVAKRVAATRHKRQDAADDPDVDDDELDDLDPKDPEETKKGWLAVLFLSFWNDIETAFNSNEFRDKLAEQAQKTAKSASDQTADTLGLAKAPSTATAAAVAGGSGKAAKSGAAGGTTAAGGKRSGGTSKSTAFAPDLTKPTQALVNDTYASASNNAAGSFDRVQDVLDDIDADDPEYSDLDDQDLEDAVADKLDDGLDGIMGKILAGAALAFGVAFGDMVQASQEDAGVTEYVWVTMNDDRVRPSHDALEGQVCSWDDPPLTADGPLDGSSNGEDCHPGDDYGCRCVASPVDGPDGELGAPDDYAGDLKRTLNGGGR